MSFNLRFLHRIAKVGAGGFTFIPWNWRSHTARVASTRILPVRKEFKNAVRKEYTSVNFKVLVVLLCRACNT